MSSRLLQKHIEVRLYLAVGNPGPDIQHPVNLQDVRKSLGELRTGLQAIQKELKEHFSDLALNDKYAKQMWAFSGKAKDQLADLVDDVNHADSTFTEVVKYYGEDDKNMSSSEFYGIFKTFVTSYKVGHNRVRMCRTHVNHPPDRNVVPTTSLSQRSALPQRSANKFKQTPRRTRRRLPMLNRRQRRTTPRSTPSSRSSGTATAWAAKGGAPARLPRPVRPRLRHSHSTPTCCSLPSRATRRSTSRATCSCASNLMASKRRHHPHQQ